jgi:DNA-binding IclR family transcriptional regulator
MVVRGKEKPTVRAVEKALNILEHLSRVQREVDLASLFNETRIPKPTLLRLLNTLKKHNLIEQNPKTQGYLIGWAFIYFGKIAGDIHTLPRVVHPFLEDLARNTGETVSLVVLEGDHAVYLDQAVSSSMIKGIPTIGAKLKLHCTAAGKMLLSAFSEGEVEALLKNYPFERKTEKTIHRSSDLKEEIGKVRSRGYATDDEETEIGGRCVAVPILDGEGRTIAAISIIGPASRMKKEDFGRLAGLAKETAIQASAALGHGARR